MRSDKDKSMLGAAIAGVLGLGILVAGVAATRDDVPAGGGGGQVAIDRRSGEVDVDTAPQQYAALVPGTEGRVGDDKVGDKIVGPKTVGPAIVGQAIVGEKKVGPKIVGDGRVGEGRVGPKRVGPAKVGPKIVGPKRVGPRYTHRYHGGGGGGGLLDHKHYPPGWTNTPRQWGGKHVPPRRY